MELTQFNLALKVPKPTSPDDILTDNSDKLAVASAPFAVKLLVDNQHWEAANAPPEHAWFDPPPPIMATLTYKIFWANMHSEVLGGPQQYKRKVTTKKGASSTTTTSFSAELGVQAGGLSAKISETLQQSITISEENEESQEWDIDVPAAKVGVWTLWQLVQEFQIVDANGVPMVFSGTMRIDLGPLLSDKVFSATLPQNTFLHRTTTFRPDLVTFNAEQA